ncbi:hypothetical protein Tco_0947496 [Tanacetum coccineum]
MIFQLLEDLREISTMRNCKDVFGYIETGTVCKRKACDVKDFQSTSSSFVKDLEASAAPMDTAAASVSPEQTPEADGGQEPGQMDEPEPEAEPDQEPELGMIDGETDAEVDTTATDSENK